MTEMNEAGKARTQKATLVLRQNTARKHAEKYIQALELIGYTVIPPQKEEAPK